jgi:hypothetical protein
MAVDNSRSFAALIEAERADARLARHEAAALVEVRRRSWHEALGYARLGDFCLEALGMAPRTGYELLALDRLLVAWPALEVALDAGRLTTCKVRALQPIARKASVMETADGAALIDAWIVVAEALPVRELAACVRGAVDAGGAAAGGEAGGPAVEAAAADDQDEATELTDRISFEAPPIIRALIDDTFEYAARLLGRRAARWECLEATLIEAAPECADAGLSREEEAAAKVRTRITEAGDVGAGEAGAEGAPPDAANVRTRDAGAGGVVAGTAEVAAAVPSAANVRTRPDRPIRRAADRDDSAPAPRRVARTDAPSPAARAAALRLEQSLARLEEALADLHDLLESGPLATAEDALLRLQYLRTLRRPLRALASRLLRDLREAGALDPWDGGRIDALLERHFGLSPRTARHRAQEARLFEDRPDLEATWAAGRIGLLPALHIQRLAPLGRAGAWLARAEAVTVRQFHREVHVMERLRLFAPDVAHCHGGPFPDAALEADLRACVESRGGEVPAGEVGRREGRCERASAADAAFRGGAADPADGADPADVADPAEDPRLLRRLESLIDALVLLASDSAAAGLAALASGAAPPVPGLSEDLAARQTFAHDAASRRKTRITLTVPRLVAAHWYAAMAAISTEFGGIPTWMSMTILCLRAGTTWRQLDPDTRPTEWRTLTRDDYTCQAPGCSARRTLEVHHIILRAQQGPDAPWNLVTLCHAHHHHGVHRGHLRVGGRAPGRLRWGLGRRRDGRPIGQFLGERRVGSGG